MSQALEKHKLENVGIWGTYEKLDEVHWLRNAEHAFLAPPQHQFIFPCSLAFLSYSSVLGYILIIVIIHVFPL